jgi:hypothetical protein
MKDKSGCDAVMPNLSKSRFEQAALAVHNDLVVDICHWSSRGKVWCNLQKLLRRDGGGEEER